MSRASRSVSEIDRRLAQMVRVAEVLEVDPARALMRVGFGGKTRSAWLPWVTARAGGTRSFSAPTVGEQVVVLSPSGNTAQGVVLPSLYGAAAGAPASEAGVERTEFSDGTVVELRAGVVMVQANSEVHIDAPLVRIVGNVEITGSLTAALGAQVTGDMSVTGDVTAGSVSLRQHVHGGVERGGSNTDQPGS